jgi:hypothetical protein
MEIFWGIIDVLGVCGNCGSVGEPLIVGEGISLDWFIGLIEGLESGNLSGSGDKERVGDEGKGLEAILILFGAFSEVVGVSFLSVKTLSDLSQFSVLSVSDFEIVEFLVEPEDTAALPTELLPSSINVSSCSYVKSVFETPPTFD